MPPLIANELKEIKLTQLELKVQQSLQLQDVITADATVSTTTRNKITAVVGTICKNSEWKVWKKIVWCDWRGQPSVIVQFQST